MARVLALDVGRRRIGIAASDPMGITAQGLETLQRTNLREDMARLCELAREKEAERWVVGLPLHMSGDESAQAGFVREFATRLERETGLPVTFVDERLTSVEANRVLRSSGISLEKRAKAVDKLSAVLILENYLDTRARSEEDNAT